MSDRARMDEIDDVLSSVRKLVSHGEKIAPRTRSRVLAQQVVEKFVLTQALRVSEEELQSESPHDENLTDEEADNILLLEANKRADRAGLERTIAELEAAVTSQPEDWEPDEGETFDDNAWAASAFQLHAVADAVDLDTGTEDASETPISYAASEPQPIMAEVTPLTKTESSIPQQAPQIDQAALHAMVAEILREELNGEMGERITRNVRKLVRREINRVLVSRDMD